MIDNYDQIKNLMNFDNDQAFYMISIYRRKKDQPEVDGQKSDNILIRDYFIKSIEHFDKIYPEIKELCNHFNARAYIRLNRCYWDKVALEVLCVVAEYIKLGNYHNIKAAFTTACGRRLYDSEKKWIIDVDYDQFIDDELLADTVQKATSGFENNIIAKIPTKNGYHWITHPFDPRELSNVAPQIDIHKNNPTILYIP